MTHGAHGYGAAMERAGGQPLDEDEMRAWRAFMWVATRALDRLEHDLQREHGLSLPDYEILVRLSEAPERQLQMTELAGQALVSQSRLTYRIDRLVREGLVERVPCESDGRRVWARLTRQGFAKLEAAYPSHLASARRYVIDPPAPGELRAMTDALEKMRVALGADDCPSAGCP